MSQNRSPGTSGVVSPRPESDNSGGVVGGVVQLGEVEIVYTDSGYTPAEVRVKVGTEVIFKNQSTALMQTASNPHPVHTLLPKFDAKRGVAVGGTYSFTFTKKGTWRYHNRFVPVHGGTIIVE